MEKDNLEILLEDIRGKFDLVLEGHEGLRKEIRDTRHELCKKIEFVDFKVETVNQKLDGVAAETRANTVAIAGLATETRANTVAIDGLATETRANTIAIKGLTHKLDDVAADLSAPRADTEAHGPVYRVKE